MATAPGAEGQTPGTVFLAIERELRPYDEQELLLANRYREEDRQRRAREARQENPGAAINGVDSDQSDEEARGELSCYNEIKSLVFIENSPIHKKALEEWTRKENLFTARVERKAKKVDSLKNEVYQLLGFFSVFQGVVLTAVAQSNLLHCNNQWSPITLSVLASVVTVAAIVQKLFQISSLQKTIHTEEEALTV